MDKYPDMKKNYTISLTPNEVALLHKAAGYARLGPEAFLVAAARHTIAQGEKHINTIVKLRAEEAELLGVKRID